MSGKIKCQSKEIETPLENLEKVKKGNEKYQDSLFNFK